MTTKEKHFFTFNERELDTLAGVLYFYRDETSHGTEDGCCGLPKGKERKRINAMLVKLGYKGD